MRRSEKSSIFLVCMMAAAALATVIPPVAFGEDVASVETSTDWELMWSLVQAEDAVGSSLAEIDQALLEASLALTETGIKGPEARSVLDDLAGLGPWVVDCITVDLNGTIIEVRPAEYQEVEGTSIKDQEHIERLLFTRRPVGLAYIKSVEGFRAMDFASPVFDERGRFIGAVTVLVNSTELFCAALSPYQPGGRAEIWVMTPDGTIIYDIDAEEIGRNTFSDPLFQQFQQLQEVATRVETDRSGQGTYEIFGTTREVFWTTTDYQGKEIRLLISVDE